MRACALHIKPSCQSLNIGILESHTINNTMFSSFFALFNDDNNSKKWNTYMIYKINRTEFYVRFFLLSEKNVLNFLVVQIYACEKKNGEIKSKSNCFLIFGRWDPKQRSEFNFNRFIYSTIERRKKQWNRAKNNNK